MSVMLHNNLLLSSNFTLDEEAKASEKQGIVSILGPGFEKTSTIPSLRRTLSADMSSQKWLAENGFSPIKKISSSYELLASIDDDDDSSSTSSSSSSDDDDDDEEEEEEEKEHLELWRSITRAQTEEDRVQEKTKESTIWSSILSHKRDEDDSKTHPSPYVHPLAKRSARAMSDKSLQICTESLGSETGSDGFSSYASSEAYDAEESPKQQVLINEEHQHGFPPVKHGHSLGPKKVAHSRDFPSPLPSLSRENGASLLMRSSRNNGRLVLEAVSVSSQNNFQAQRHDGRLILTFVKNHNQEAEKVETVDDDEAVMELDDDEAVMELDEESVVIFSEKLGDEDKGTEVAVKEKVPSISSGVINLHKLALMMNKPIGLQSKFNEVINKHKSAEDEEEENEPISIQQSLSILSQMGRMNPTPTAKAVSSFNAYEYFWRTKPTTAASASVISITKQPFPSLKNYNTITMSKNYTTTMVKGCKEPMRSMIIWDWEPNCIATS